MPIVYRSTPTWSTRRIYPPTSPYTPTQSSAQRFKLQRVADWIHSLWRRIVAFFLRCARFLHRQNTQEGVVPAEMDTRASVITHRLSVSDTGANIAGPSQARRASDDLSFQPPHNTSVFKLQNSDTGYSSTTRFLPRPKSESSGVGLSLSTLSLLTHWDISSQEDLISSETGRSSLIPSSELPQTTDAHSSEYYHDAGDGDIESSAAEDDKRDMSHPRQRRKHAHKSKDTSTTALPKTLETLEKNVCHTKIFLNQQHTFIEEVESMCTIVEDPWALVDKCKEAKEKADAWQAHWRAALAQFGHVNQNNKYYQRNKHSIYNAIEAFDRALHAHDRLQNLLPFSAEIGNLPRCNTDSLILQFKESIRALEHAAKQVDNMLRQYQIWFTRTRKKHA